MGQEGIKLLLHGYGPQLPCSNDSESIHESMD